jgi:hypothetical protein
MNFIAFLLCLSMDTSDGNYEIDKFCVFFWEGLERQSGFAIEYFIERRLQGAVANRAPQA